MFDRLPTWLQHVITAVLSAFISTLAIVLPQQQDGIVSAITSYVPEYARPFVGPAIVALIYQFTTWTRQWGSGSNPSDGTPQDQVAA